MSRAKRGREGRSPEFSNHKRRLETETGGARHMHVARMTIAEPRRGT